MFDSRLQTAREVKKMRYVSKKSGCDTVVTEMPTHRKVGPGFTARMKYALGNPYLTDVFELTKVK